MKILQYLTHSRYIAILMILLGVSFQLSTAASNMVFYLLSLSGLSMVALCLKNDKAALAEVIRSPLWKVVTLWVVLLYVSSLYSTADEQLYQFAKKYFRYFLVGAIALLALIQLRRGEDLTKRFFLGFAAGGALSFFLAMLNKTTGWLTALVSQGWFSWEYVKNDYWVSNGAFVHSVFMALLFAYGLMAWTRNQKIMAVICCLLSLIEIFIVSNQRTGYVAVIILSLWFLGMTLPTWGRKVAAGVTILGLAFVVLFTHNPISQRVDEVSYEWQQCQLPLTEGQQVTDTDLACFTSIGLRKVFWYDGLDTISAAWLTGYGMGNVSLDTLAYKESNQQFIKEKTQNPHNEYILQGVQLGVIGVLLVVALFSLAFSEAMQLKKKRSLLYSGIVIVYAVSCLYNSFLFDALESLFFVLLLAFIIAERAFEREKP